jgi:hypothetical protein
MPRTLPEPHLVPLQTQLAPPTEWEDRLADAIEAAFAAGAWDLPDLVEAVSEQGVTDPSGAPWTIETFRAELDRLGR